MRHGRSRPYTVEGVKRLPCVRCGEPASFQWNACSDGNLWRPVCKDCDVELNGLVLRFMEDPDWREKMTKYKEKMFGGKAKA